MEDLILFLLQGGFEIVVTILGWIGEGLLYGLNLFDLFNLLEALSDAVGSFLRNWPALDSGARANWISVFNLIAGLMTGAISLHFYHDAFLRRSAVRLLALALGPVFSGGVSWVSSRFWIFFNAAIRPRYCFWWGFFFSLGLCLIRFGFAHRPNL